MTKTFLSTKQKFAEIADEFLDFIKDKKIIIHNAEFDIGHLNNELSLIGKQNGDLVNVSTPSGEKSFEVIKVEYI